MAKESKARKNVKSGVRWVSDPLGNVGVGVTILF